MVNSTHLNRFAGGGSVSAVFLFPVSSTASHQQSSPIAITNITVVTTFTTLSCGHCVTLATSTINNRGTPANATVQWDSTDLPSMGRPSGPAYQWHSGHQTEA